MLGSLKAVDSQPALKPLDQRTRHDLARFVAAVSIAPNTRVGELHLVRVLAPMISDDLPVSAGHRRNPVHGLPLA